MTELRHAPTSIFAEDTLPEGWQPDRTTLIPGGIRREAWEVAQATRFPVKKDEPWRWVNFEGLPFSKLSRQLMTFRRIPSLAGEGLSLPAGAFCTDMPAARREHPELVAELAGQVVAPTDGKFAAIATALADSGVFIYIPAGMTIERPIYVRLESTGENGANFSHSIIWLEDGAAASVILELGSQASNQGGLHNGVLEVRLGKGAHLNLSELQELGSGVANITTERALLQKNARLDWTYGAIGSKTSKTFITVDLVGEGSEALLNGFYFSGSGQLINLDTQQNHMAPHTNSNLRYRGAASGNGSAVWEGMIYVDSIAQQTDGYQSNRNLILDDGADIKTIPGLEIRADDVSCSHGATVGRLDDDELFYLQTRGISYKEAERVIVAGFFADVLGSVPLDALKKSLGKKLADKFINLSP